MQSIIDTNLIGRNSKHDSAAIESTWWSFEITNLTAVMPRMGIVPLYWLITYYTLMKNGCLYFCIWSRCIYHSANALDFHTFIDIWASTISVIWILCANDPDFGRNIHTGMTCEQKRVRGLFELFLRGLRYFVRSIRGSPGFGLEKSSP